MKAFVVLACWILAASVIVVTLGPATDRPQLGHPQAERFWAFAVLGFTSAFAYPARPRRLAASLTAGAIILEALQFFASGRDPRLPDALIKMAGALVGIALMASGRRLLAPALAEAEQGGRHTAAGIGGAAANRGDDLYPEP